MRRVFAVLAIVVVACGISFAQDAKEEADVEYEKLKVLEPLLGTWCIKGENENFKWEGCLTLSWSNTQKLVEGQFVGRRAEANDDLSKQEWLDWRREYYVWNHEKHQIEFVQARPLGGAIIIKNVNVKGDGVFTYDLLRTINRSATEDVKVSVTDNEMTIELTNRKGPGGEALEDRKPVYQRVKRPELLETVKQTLLEAEGEENAEDEKLKILAPMIGSWLREWTDDDGVTWKSLVVDSWSLSKKMLIDQHHAHKEKNDKSPWKPNARGYWYWNQETKRIEFCWVSLPDGTVSFVAVKPMGNGNFSYSLVSTTKRWGTADMTFSVNEQEYAFRSKNGEDLDGEPSPDVELIWHRVKEPKKDE